MLRMRTTTRVVSSLSQTALLNVATFFQQGISPALKISLLVFLLGRIGFSLWGALIGSLHLVPTYLDSYYYNIEPVTRGISGALLGMWQRWDAIHYQRIVLYGYEDAQLTAFFPLYPLLAKVISTFSGANALLSLMLVSSLAFLFSLYFFYRIVADIDSPELARQTLVSLLIFPTAFFFYALLPQSLLLLFILMAYWFARKEQWGSSAAACFLAGLTHPLSMPLSLLIGWEALPVLLGKRSGSRLAAAAAPFANFVAIGGFLLWRKLIGFPSYTGVQTENWGTSLHTPWEGLLIIGKHVFTLQPTAENFIYWLQVLFFLFIIGLLVWGIGKIPTGMYLYSAGVMILYVMTNHTHEPLHTVLRYPVMIFPLYMLIAQIGRTSKFWQLFKFGFSVVLGFICATMYFMWSVGYS